MSRSRKSPLSVEQRVQVVLSVLAGEMTASEAARRHGVTPTTVATWRDRFIDAGRQGLQHGLPGPAGSAGSSAERRLRAEAEELKLALAEATVQLRIWQKGEKGAECRRGHSPTSRR